MDVLAVVTDLFFSVKVLGAAQQAGKAVRFAKTADAALELAAQGPSLVVMDLNCREVDTVELIRRIRGAGLQDLPILGFLSHVQEERKRQAQEAGCDRVLARSAFSDRIRQILEEGISGTLRPRGSNPPEVE